METKVHRRTRGNEVLRHPELIIRHRIRLRDTFFVRKGIFGCWGGSGKSLRRVVPNEKHGTPITRFRVLFGSIWCFYCLFGIRIVFNDSIEINMEIVYIKSNKTLNFVNKIKKKIILPMKVLVIFSYIFFAKES